MNDRPLTILNVAYPLAPVSPDTAGGAEQVVAQIDAALVAAGHRSLVVACEGSQVAGQLIAVPAASGPLDDVAIAHAHDRHRSAIERALRRYDIDVVHLHGVDFVHYLPVPGVPILVTLHLPLSWYPPGIFAEFRQDVRMHCVSRSQARDCPAGARLMRPIPNGVPIGALRVTRAAKPDTLLCLGRICPEKGYDVALDAAHRAGLPLILAGRVYDYPSHRRYFRDEIVPRLDTERCYIGPVDSATKRALFAAARAVIVPSRVAETSSLVAMEALASGTPVIASSAGALPEIVDHGSTGYVADGVDAIVAAIRRLDRLRSEDCRAAARQRFSLRRTTALYLERYRRLATAHAAVDRVASSETADHAA